MAPGPQGEAIRIAAMPAHPPPPASYLYTPQAVRALEASAAQWCEGGAAGLMARAGQAAWHCLRQAWPDARRVLVVCGPGNNGGDGYVLARLARAAGVAVQVLRLPNHAPATPLAKAACAEYQAQGGVVDTFAGQVPDVDVVVDAVFGLGLSRPPEADCSALLAALARTRRPVLALDVPSGVQAATGQVPGTALPAQITLQFLAPHVGLQTGAALDYVGRRLLAPLQVPGGALEALEPAAVCLDAGSTPIWGAPRARDSHKGQSGHVLCIGGEAGMGGAIALAAESALRCGAGLVSVATRAAHVAPLLARRPEVMAHAVEDAGVVAPLLARADVVALGPGLGQSPWAQQLYRLACAAGRPLVLDADALHLLAARPCALPPETVLTPHPGEAARLLGVSTARVQADRLAAAEQLAGQTGAVVVLKGAGTVVAAPDELPRLVSAGNPGMASAGMGDVLTGCIAALRAQGMRGFEAACAGALLHALAGDAAAADAGERGLLASDLFAALRRQVNT